MTKTRSRTAIVLTLGAFAALAHACGDTLLAPDVAGIEEVPFEPQFALIATELQPVSDQTQVAPAGTRVPEDPRVRAIGDDGTGVAGVSVEFRVLTGGGTTTASVVLTDVEGYASTGWTLGPEAEVNRLRAIAPALNRVNFAATAYHVVVGSVTITPPSLHFDALGQMEQLSAVARDTAGQVVPVPVSWRSLSSGVARVDSTGMVRSVANGRTRVIAEAEGRADTVWVIVDQVVRTIVTSPATDTLATGETVDLDATARDANGYPIEGVAFSWRSGNAAVATVTSSGLTTAVAEGVVMVRAYAETVIGGSRITVRSDSTPPPPDDAGMVFHSDFSTARGNTTAALLDTDQPVHWTSLSGNGRLNEVIASTGLDFPTANVLRVVAGYRSGGGAQAQTHRLDGALPVPAIGASLYYRWYLRVVIPNAYNADPATHPIQDAGPTDQNWVFDVVTRPDGNWNMRFGSAATAWPNNRWGGDLLFRKGETYRFELRVLRTGTTTFTIDARVYDSSGALLYDGADFRNVNGTATLASAPTLNTYSATYFNGITAGFNGLSAGTQAEFPITLYYQSAFCVRTDTWCGPYRVGEGN